MKLSNILVKFQRIEFGIADNSTFFVPLCRDRRKPAALRLEFVEERSDDPSVVKRSKKPAAKLSILFKETSSTNKKPNAFSWLNTVVRMSKRKNFSTVWPCHCYFVCSSQNVLFEGNPPGVSCKSLAKS